MSFFFFFFLSEKSHFIPHVEGDIYIFSLHAISRFFVCLFVRFCPWPPTGFAAGYCMVVMKKPLVLILSFIP